MLQNGDWKFINDGYLGVSKHRGTPKWMVEIMENPIKMDDLGVPLFLEKPIWTWEAICYKMMIQTSWFPYPDLRRESLQKRPLGAHLFGSHSSSYMDVSENRGTPKSSILMRFSIVNHPV